MKSLSPLLMTLLSVAAVALGQNVEPADTTATQADNSIKRDKFVEKVTVKEVRRFLDPTRMVKRVDYSFQASWLPSDIKLYAHELRPWIPINSGNAISIRIPYRYFSLADGNGPSGFGDVTAGWGFILRENLRSRVTTLAGGLELLLPTGDFAAGTGFDTWVVSPAVLLATNPTDLFPVNITVRYKHSLGPKGGSETAGFQVRLLDVALQTFHILPRGFYLAFIPTYQWNLEQDYNVFSFGAGIGRALNRQLAIDVTYVQFISGKQTFIRGVRFGLQFLWGRDLGRP